jgi:hypothetical protein
MRMERLASPPAGRARRLSLHPPVPPLVAFENSAYGNVRLEESLKELSGLHSRTLH